MKSSSLPSFVRPVFLASLLVAGTAAGGDPNAAAPASAAAKGEADAFERIWSIPVIYENDDNPFIQSLAFTGRYQGQWHDTSANTGSDDGWENRRTRFGLAAAFLKHFTLEGEFNLSWESDARFFQDVDTLSLKYAPNDNFYITAGKQKVRITQEYATSNAKILTFERSLLVNQLVPEKVGGLVAGWTFDKFFLEGGVYSGDLSEDWLLPGFGAGWGFALRGGYRPSKDSEIRLDFFHQDGDADSVAFEPYDNILSLNTANKWGRWGLNGDIIFASGMSGTPDVYGLTIMPYFDISKKVRAVLRYQFASSDESDGLNLQRRYERPAVKDGSGTRGRDYHSIYAGINYYIYGDKLKLMNGIEYSTMDGHADYDGWTFFSGIRLYF